MAAFWGILIAVACANSCMADEILYRYEGDVLPSEEGTGWEVFNPCEGPCSEQIVDGKFVLTWDVPNDSVNYSHRIATPESPPPPETLWVEWQFRSNHPIGPIFFTCDGSIGVQYQDIVETIRMYGDVFLSSAADFFEDGLSISSFHTGRFESRDGLNFRFSVDGNNFYEDKGNQGNGFHSIQMRGFGACEDFNNTVNEWDYVRYGTISDGEEVASVSPVPGFVEGLDRFEVTFDAPGYVYIDEIVVESSSGTPPEVVKVWRTGEANPETVEIVLDGPLPDDALTTFTWDDGVVTNQITYSRIRGDHNADGFVDVLDFPDFAVCEAIHGVETSGGSLPSVCRAFDFDGDERVTFADFASFQLAAGSQ